MRASIGYMEGYANMICYPHKPGKYTYFDKEGGYEITQDGRVIASPAGNPSTYIHPVQPWTALTNFSLLRDSGDYLVFEPISTEEIGDKCYFMQYHFFVHDNSLGAEPPADP